MWLAEPLAGLAAVLAILLTPPTPSDEMQRYIDQGYITGAEAGVFSPLLWDALLRHGIPPLWERDHYCGRSAYAMAAATLRGESLLNPLIVHRNGDGSEDWGIAQLNSRQPPEPVSMGQAMDPSYAIDYFARHLAKRMEMRWHAWGKVLRPRWCG